VCFFNRSCVDYPPPKKTHAHTKAEDKLESISQELANSREREAELRQSGAEVANKIEWFSLLSITVRYSAITTPPLAALHCIFPVY